MVQLRIAKERSLIFTFIYRGMFSSKLGIGETLISRVYFGNQLMSKNIPTVLAESNSIPVTEKWILPK